MPACLCVHYMEWCPCSPEESVRDSGAGGRGSCRLPCMCLCWAISPSHVPSFECCGEGIVMLPEASEKHSEEQNTNLIGFSIRGIKINEHKKVKFILQGIIKDQLHYAKLKYKSLECVSICSHVYMHVCWGKGKTEGVVHSFSGTFHFVSFETGTPLGLRALTD